MRNKHTLNCDICKYRLIDENKNIKCVFGDKFYNKCQQEKGRYALYALDLNKIKEIKSKRRKIIYINEIKE